MACSNCSGSKLEERAMKTRLAVGLVALVVLTTACSQQELYGQLSERQANEMVAVLRSAGLSADKTRRENNKFALTTAASDFSRAVEMLHGAGYPREHFDSLGEVFKKEGFVSTPLEERARFMHALSQELSSTISQIDGVVVARVHLAVPEKDSLADKPKTAAASVFIKHRAGVDLTPHLGRIKALVVNSVEGLPYEAVTVVTFPAEAWPAAAGGRAAQAALGPAQGLDTPLRVMASLGGVALLFGALWWAWQHRRQLAKPKSPFVRGEERGAVVPRP
jgi:type III secretion protein J